ncbi:hypothetical protein PYR71_19160 [Rhizobium sp. MC63]|uniref:Uncharacterized protein n=1 Tax=Rhizobium mulingense TaxID=3031128 RepID=A0ACC6N426_9HYPH|nr:MULTISPECIES: hypothetical protein [unclassified Rhizobium]MDF0698589.1 hypothetical protein [Rhizobium sp. MC63]MEA3520185.1 hypothetical protein [Rhizobium sp. MJ31]
MANEAAGKMNNAGGRSDTDFIVDITLDSIFAAWIYGSDKSSAGGDQALIVGQAPSMKSSVLEPCARQNSMRRSGCGFGETLPHPPSFQLEPGIHTRS